MSTRASGRSRTDRQVQVFVREMPPILKARLVEEAAAQRISVNDVVVGELGRRWRIPYRPGSRVATANPNKTNMTLRMPKRMRTELKRRADLHDTNMSAIVIATLRDIFDL